MVSQVKTTDSPSRRSRELFSKWLEIKVCTNTWEGRMRNSDLFLLAIAKQQILKAGSDMNRYQLVRSQRLFWGSLLVQLGARSYMPENTGAESSRKKMSPWNLINVTGNTVQKFKRKVRARNDTHAGGQWDQKWKGVHKAEQESDHRKLTENPHLTGAFTDPKRLRLAMLHSKSRRGFMLVTIPIRTAYLSS